jgi:diguanylate cyclase (GGDEF)-like protein
MIFYDMGLFEKAQIDFLTGFFLRESFGSFLEKAMREAIATKGAITLALVDLDHFKKFNDKFGHDFGDEVLKYAASTIRLTMDENQTYFFRYGGDEFVVVFVGKTSKEAYQLLRNCRHNLLHRPFLLRNQFHKITMSIGIVSFPQDAQTVEDLVARADSAMYYSKKHGRNRITLWNNIHHLKSRTIFVIIGILLIIALAVAASFRLTVVRDRIAPIFTKMKQFKMKAEMGPPDKVIMKNGTVFEGKIVSEDDRMILLRLNLEKGEGSLRIDKAKVLKILRAPAR